MFRRRRRPVANEAFASKRTESMVRRTIRTQEAISGHLIREAELRAAIEYRTLEIGESVTIGDATVRSTLLNHPVTDFGYCVECNGKSVFFSGDNEPWYNIYDPDDAGYAEFQAMIDLGDQTNILLATHLLSLKQVLYFIGDLEDLMRHNLSDNETAYEKTADEKTREKALHWLKYLNGCVDSEHAEYNMWPTWVQDTLEQDPHFFTEKSSGSSEHN